MLKDALEAYKKLRENENKYTSTIFWCIPVGFDRSTKLAAVQKLLADLNHQQVQFTEDDLDALRQGRLGKIVGAHSRELSENFYLAEGLKARRQHDREMNEAIMCFPGAGYA